MNEAYLQEVMQLPEACDACGCDEGSVVRAGIEAPDGKLLREVACLGCGKKSLLPDELAEWSREVASDKFFPTWYLTEGGEVVHWNSPEGRTRRMEAALEGPIGSKKSE